MSVDEMNNLPISFARDGYYFAAFFIATGLVADYFVSEKLAYIAFTLAIFSFFFFRDPKRAVPLDPNGIIAAADGKIRSVEEFNETEFIKGPAVRIVTVLSILNVHINRAPIAGRVCFQRREKGKHYAAYKEKAAKNNRNYIGIANDDVSVIVVQMVGIVARRIVSWVKDSESILMGEKIGLIRFGSRTDVIIPKSKISEILVKPGDKVKGGETVLAKIAK